MTRNIADPAMRELYRTVTLFEFTTGGRTHETFPISRVNSTLPTTTATNDELDENSCIHILRANEVQFNWPSGSLFAFEFRRFPSYPPISMNIYGTSKNNPSGKGVTTISINPRMEGSTTMCIVTELWNWVRKRRQDLPAHEFLFLGAHDRCVRDHMRFTARRVGLDPFRIFITSLRIGCQSATTAAIHDLSQESMQRLAQQFQHWHTSGGANTYHISQFNEGFIKTIQLYHLATTTIAETIARFMRF
jgi:hypothetical protein